jgi:hypothetical protein
MSNLTIFKNDIPAEFRSQGVSELTKTLAGAGRSTNRRITVKNGVFRKLVNGEEVGKLKGELNVIIVNALPAVSRQFYAAEYDPNGTPTLPDCWSNLGDKPESNAANPQASNCQSCPQNVAGSGGGSRRACAYQRRIAVVLENDPNGEVYQMNLSSTSIFGKGEGNIHPFESYSRFLAANNESIDGIVTTISVDEDADNTKLLFSPVRHLTDEEQQVINMAGTSAEAKNVVRLTVAQQDGVKKLPAAAQEEFAPIPKAAPAVEAEEVIAEPVKRASSKPAAPTAKTNLADVVNAWSDEE